MSEDLKDNSTGSNGVAQSDLLGVGECGLHTRTPYGITNVSMTQLSIARHYGGIKYNGETYTYLPKTDELIRNDVLKWKRKQKRNRESIKGDTLQTNLFA